MPSKKSASKKQTAQKNKSPKTETPQEFIHEQQEETLQKASPKAADKPILKDIDMDSKTSSSTQKANPIATIFTVIIIVLAGTVTGFGINKAVAKKQVTSHDAESANEILKQGVAVGTVVGNPDKETFSDSAEGVLVKGGLEGEGSHHLLRPGGVSQTVYLTSSVLDLDELVNHKVKVFGETFAAQKAGWLMDVGRVEVIQLNAEKPFEEE